MNDTKETIATAAKPQTKRPRKMAREPKASDAPAAAEAGALSTSTKRESKTGLVLGLLQRSDGATINQIAAATGWLPHTTRAALTGLKKKGHVIESGKVPGNERVYHAGKSKSAVR